MSKGKKLKRIEESLYGGGRKSSAELIVGKFISNARGFGFVSVDDMDDDIKHMAPDGLADMVMTALAALFVLHAGASSDQAALAQGLGDPV